MFYGKLLRLRQMKTNCLAALFAYCAKSELRKQHSSDADRAFLYFGFYSELREHKMKRNHGIMGQNTFRPQRHYIVFTEKKQ